jgi:PAS domain S-box-containing protein
VPPSAPALASDPLTILVADDCPDTREFVAVLLASQTCRVITVDNGADALEAMRVHAPDAVLLDLMMPILDGWKVLAERARHPVLNELPVICMSALVDVEDRVKAEGASAFLPKPLNCKTLLAAIDQVVVRERQPASQSTSPQAAITARIDTAVRESELLYRTLLEQAWDGVLLFDDDLRCLWGNRHASELFGWNLEELCRLNYTELIHDPEDSRGIADTPRVERECRRRDGSTFTAEVSIKHVDERRVQVLIRDVTRIKLLEEEFRQAQKMDAMGRLAGGVAHDFNNILTVIIGISEIAMAQAASGEAVMGDLREIHQAASKAAALTHQLLAFSRKQLLSVRPVNVHEHIEGLSTLLRRILPVSIQLRCDLRAAWPMIEADPNQLDQVFLNLAVNAKAAMGEGGVLTISTDNEASGSGSRTVAVRIADTGTGMSPETQARIFEPFFTTRPAGEGTGLGLSMVYGIVTQLGGAIQVRSQLGAGTVFTMQFPCSSNADKPLPSSSVAVNAVTDHERILLVDDDEAVRRMGARALEKLGYSVHATSSSTEALTLLTNPHNRFDLVITDIMMPAVTGIELVKEARRHQPHVRVLYVSGYAAETASVDESAGETAFLQKPFTLEQMAMAVRALLSPLPRA